MIDLIRLSLLCLAGCCLALAGFAIGRARERGAQAERLEKSRRTMARYLRKV